MLHFSAPSRFKITAAIVSAGLLPCAFALAFHGSTRQHGLAQYQALVETTTITPNSGSNELPEVGLQETLDRLGYTVNVPTTYGGHELLCWNNYRKSTGNDSLSATSFHAAKTARFTLISEQAMLAANLDFGVTDAQGRKRMLLQPRDRGTGYWMSAEDGDSCAASIGQNARFYINDRHQVFHTGPLSSAPQANADHAPHLLALTARKGGEWVDEGNNTGHWEGGRDTGAILLCWEDWQDFDYQDMVIVAENVTPE